MAGGRPTIMTDEVIAKLESMFLVGANATQACIYAEISEDAFYKYKKKHPEFGDRIEKLKGMTSIRAKLNIDNAILGGDMNTSKWHLERRDPEYKPKSSQDVNVGAQESLVDLILKAKEKAGK